MLSDAEEEVALLTVEVGVDAVGALLEDALRLLDRGAAGPGVGGTGLSERGVAFAGFEGELVGVCFAPVGGELAGEGVGGEGCLKNQ